MASTQHTPPKLPADAHIAPEKLSGYLLVPQTHGDKSKFLALGGYGQGNAERLAQDLRTQVLSQDALLLETNTYGQVYVIRAHLTGPNGHTLRVRTIWMTERLSGRTKFITLFPEKGSLSS